MKLLKPASCIPQCILFLEQSPDFYSALSPVHFLKGLSLAILCLFHGPFSTVWCDTKKITCISQRVITLLVQRTSGEDEWMTVKFEHC